ncbi:hypothetical protein GALMADRAFT_593325 [Galerina marginata CBS 339.88]|uniref:DUF6533 domain-containing protein n=1 Tax=Galerina marginata (strain CBS 339.88) TaxID=685588 RepID=A0A067T1S0_GALM3|nr:hypothetical protein GALMADRAFT_593325 [Galerina marginata CBS 339.88]
MPATTASLSILRGLRGIQAARYARLASGSIMTFDYAMTFDREVDLIWKSKWSFVKILFLTNRYYALGSVIYNNYVFLTSNLDTTVCANFYQWQSWTGLIGSMLTEGILQLRVYALYANNKWIIAIVFTSFILCSAAAAWVVGYSLSSFQGVQLAWPRGGKFCSNLSPPRLFYVFWIPILAFEAFLCSLALIRGFQASEYSGSLLNRGQRLLHILIRDSLLYFLA